MPQNRPPNGHTGWESRVRVVLSSYGSRGDVEPLVGLAGHLSGLGVEVVACAPDDDDFRRRFRDVGVGMVAVGPSARALSRSAPAPASLPERAARVIASQVEAIGAVIEGCDVLVATGVTPAIAGALSVAERAGVRAVPVTFQQITLPSPARPPLAYPGRPFPEGVTDNRALWALDAENINALFRDAVNTNRTAMGLPPVDDVRGYVIGDRPWVATDPLLDPLTADAVQTGAWFAADTRALPDDLSAFLDAGTPPVYVGFGSTARADARAALEAVRAHGRRAVVSRGWAELDAIDGDNCFAVGEVDHQALFPRMAAVVHHGGAGTTATAALAGVPQVVLPQGVDQPYWASRVVDLEIGATGPDPAEALATALELGTRARAAVVAGSVRRDGVAVAARLLGAA